MSISYYISIALGALEADDTPSANLESSNDSRVWEIDIDTLIYLIANPVLAFIDAAFDAEIVSVKDERE